MRALIVTLVHKQYGPALASWAAAARYWLDNEPGVRFDHLKLYGGNEGGDGHSIVVRKYQEAQNIFLLGEWDTFIALEDDMVIPPDAFMRLHKMMQEGADIAYGLYVWRHGRAAWSAYSKLDANGGISLSREREAAQAAGGRAVDVAGVGLGCTAIKRDVLEKIRFRRGGLACNDWYMAMDAQAQGFKQRCDLGLICGHMTLSPSPRILYPNLDSDSLYRVEYL